MEFLKNAVRTGNDKNFAVHGKVASVSRYGQRNSAQPSPIRLHALGSNGANVNSLGTLSKDQQRENEYDGMLAQAAAQTDLKTVSDLLNST